MSPPAGSTVKFQDTAAIDAMEIDILRKRLSEVAAERHQISAELTRSRQMVISMRTDRRLSFQKYLFTHPPVSLLPSLELRRRF